MDHFDEQVERVKRLTGLTSRDASAVAIDVGDDTLTAVQLIERARELGFEVAENADAAAAKADLPDAPAPEVSMDPEVVLAEVYKHTPRVLCAAMPVIGKAPRDIEIPEELLEQLPEEVRLLVGSIDLVNEHVTIALYDEANEVDRVIGPIDLRRYEDGQQLKQAIDVLLARLPRVLAADFN